MATATFELPDDLARMLEEAADSSGRTCDEIVAEALRDHLRHPASRGPTSIGAYADPELSGADSEDWLRDHWRPD
jgi:hypothetical protein